jgi:hypothetical protein
MLIHYRQHKISTANVDSLRITQFRQQMRIRCRHHTFSTNADLLQTIQNFSSECWFAANNTISAANADSLQTSHFQQRTPVRYKQHTFGSKRVFATDNTNSAANTCIAADNTIR